MLRLLVKLRKIIDVRKGTNVQHTIDEIRSNIHLSGSNFWNLLCSALLASIGLDISSPAVIIGGMLVSPLMSPIIGIGLSFGINDRETLILSLREFIYYVVISLLISIIYFYLTPLGLPTNEILARIKPTLLDVIIAFFGGTAGIIALSRVKTSTAIPGVAIATALMPPLCTAGFGLAKGLPSFFFGAFYLFFINAVFIIFASYIVVRALNFPYKEYLHPGTGRKVKWVFIIILLIVMAPSIYIFTDIIKQTRNANNIKQFIDKNVNNDSTQVLDWKLLNESDTLSELRLYTIGERISSGKRDSLNIILKNNTDSNLKLTIVQSQFAKSISDVQQTTNPTLLKADDKELIEPVDTEKEPENKFDIAAIDNELRILFPDMLDFAYTPSQEVKDSVKIVPTILLKWSPQKNRRTMPADESKMTDFLKLRMDLDTLRIITY